MRARKPRAIVEPFAARPMVVVVVVVVVMVVVIVRMIVVVRMIMMVMMRVCMSVIVLRRNVVMRVVVLFALGPVAFLGRRSAAANRAHHSTSSSLTRISSPAVI
jgi:hypothetical protein